MDQLAVDNVFGDSTPILFQMTGEPYAAFAVTHWQVTVTCPKQGADDDGGEEEDGEEGNDGNFSSNERRRAARRP